MPELLILALLFVIMIGVLAMLTGLLENTPASPTVPTPNRPAGGTRITPRGKVLKTVRRRWPTWRLD